MRKPDSLIVSQLQLSARRSGRDGRTSGDTGPSGRLSPFTVTFSKRRFSSGESALPTKRSGRALLTSKSRKTMSLTPRIFTPSSTTICTAEPPSEPEHPSKTRFETHIYPSS